ncbi:MAG: hypothetical protein JRJ85_08935 [Deltaproteobacteria bacterium]|nr:hypothetical protein [Deltaproteobacteria bacterium]
MPKSIDQIPKRPAAGKIDYQRAGGAQRSGTACRTVDRSPVHPREVFADALADRASGIVVAHNHPASKGFSGGGNAVRKPVSRNR